MVLAGQRQTARSHNHTISGHFPLDFDQPSEATGHARVRLENGASGCRCREFERAECGDPKSEGETIDDGDTRGCGDAADLGEHLDQNDGGNYRLSWEVALEVEVMRRCDSVSDRADAGIDRGDGIE